MVINEKGLRDLMTAAFKKNSTGYKVALRQLDGGDPQIILSTADWTVIIEKENTPRKVLALIVEHLGDLPEVGQAFHVKAGNAQAEIYSMAAPESVKHLRIQAKRTQITYMGYTLYQCEDSQQVHMIPPKLENLLDSKLLPLYVADDGRLYQGGLVSQVYIKPYVPMKGDMQALQHFAEHKWI